jgi:hypothetical protein
MKRRLDALIDGSTPEAATAALERHVASCEVCGRYVESTRWVQAAFTEARPEFVPPDRAASRQMFENALEASGALQSRRETLRYGMMFASACCVLAMIGIGVRFVSHAAHIGDDGGRDMVVSLPDTVIGRHIQPPGETISPVMMRVATAGGRKTVSAFFHRRHRRASHRYLIEACHLLQEGSDETAVASAAPEPRLSISVSCEAPPLEVTVTHEPESAPGYAYASAAETEPSGASTCTDCRVSLQTSDTGDTQVKRAYLDADSTLHSFTVQFAYHADCQRGAFQ